MPQKPSDFMEYLGLSHQNLIARLADTRLEFDLFYSLDQLFPKPPTHISSSIEPNILNLILSLYLLVHEQLYCSMQCLLQGHVNNSFAPTRIAIDATFTAYIIFKEEDQHEQLRKASIYVRGGDLGEKPKAERTDEEQKDFQEYRNIFEKAKNYIKGNIPINLSPASDGKFYCLQELVMRHEHYSSFGGHADFSSFANRLYLKDEGFIYHYFSTPQDKKEYKTILLRSVGDYACMLRIFSDFLSRLEFTKELQLQEKSEALIKIIFERLQTK